MLLWQRFVIATIVPAVTCAAVGAAFVVSCAPASALAAGDAERQVPAENEEPAADSRPSPTFVETITVTATRGPRPIKDASGTMTVIGSEQLEQMMASDFSDAVRYVPGVYVESSAGGGAPSAFNIRGIGGNRVLTRIDGIAAAEQFEFGPFLVPRPTLDLDAVRSLEILHSAGSPLYGSDALGGVVSLLTKDPADYLGTGGTGFHAGLKVGYDGRDSQLAEALTLAAGSSRWQGSLLLSRRDGEEPDNRGHDHASDTTRTARDPQDWAAEDLLAKLVFLPTAASSFELVTERLVQDTAARAYSSQGISDQSLLLGPGMTRIVEVSDAEAAYRQRRERLSLEHAFEVGGGWFDRLLWRAFSRSADSEQATTELRATTQGGGRLGPLRTTRLERAGLLTFEQDTIGGELQMQKSFGSRNLMTWGLAVGRDRFEQLRDSRDLDLDTGEPAVAFSAFVFPTRYFPPSKVRDLGVYVQSEIELARRRLRLVPGVRYDVHELDVDRRDRIYLEGNPGIELPADMRAGAVSPRLGVTLEIPRGLTLYGQWARGFRAPPMSAVNSGFTSLVLGVTRLPNPDLEPETSDNYELGLRGSFRRGGFSLVRFDNRYRDFIELVVLGRDPASGLLEFQHRNVNRARISGFEVAADLMLGSSWTARMGYSAIDGEDRSRQVPLNSPPPEKLVLNLSYTADDGRWGSALRATQVAAKALDEVDNSGIEPFRPPSHSVLDLTAFWKASDRLSLEAGIFNLLDEKYWRWADVLGQEQSSPILDRYTSPGVSAGATVRYRW